MVLPILRQPGSLSAHPILRPPGTAACFPGSAALAGRPTPGVEAGDTEAPFETGQTGTRPTGAANAAGTGGSIRKRKTRRFGLDGDDSISARLPRSSENLERTEGKPGKDRRLCSIPPFSASTNFHIDHLSPNRIPSAPPAVPPRPDRGAPAAPRAVAAPRAAAPAPVDRLKMQLRCCGGVQVFCRVRGGSRSK